MGAAKLRGTFEERKAAAIAKAEQVKREAALLESERRIQEWQRQEARAQNQQEETPTGRRLSEPASPFSKLSIGALLAIASLAVVSTSSTFSNSDPFRED